MALLPRLHLFEFTDQPWLPGLIRQGEVDYLQTLLDKLRPYDALVPALSEVLALSFEPRVVDLCSGAGGPWRTLAPALRDAGTDCTVLLTDAYPVQRPGMPPGVAWHPKPVDALAVPPELTGVRTIFEGLHRFRPDQARALLADACAAQVPIVVGELTVRRLGPLLIQALLIAPLVWIVTLFIRPVTWWRLLLTYPLPLLPLLITWDGLVSSLRTYTPTELQELTQDLDQDGYTWQVQTLRHRGAELTTLTGRPGTRG